MNGGVPITGAGCLCALGADSDACVRALFPAREEWTRPRTPQRFSTSHERDYPVFELASELVARLPGGGGFLLTARMGLAATLEALRNAGLDAERALRGLRVGVCMGTTVGSAMNNEAFYRRYRQGETPDMTPILRYLRSNPAAVIAEALTARGAAPGPVQCVCNACSSGADAIGVGASWIRAGLCDLAIAGGADELCRVTYNGFVSLMIHSQEPCRPFDAQRAGLNLGEGAAVLVLERDDARRGRGAESFGRVLGCGMSCDAHHLTAPHPEGRGLRQALAQALEQAGLESGDVAFVNAHGTGTKDNDRVESVVLADALPHTPFFSTKARTGHTLGAAGAIEAVLTLGCLRQGRIPASAGYAVADGALPARPVMETRPVRGKAALSFSLAFGGSNAVLALGA